MSQITFRLNGVQYQVDSNTDPMMTLNEYIRTVAELRGTKAMCNEGGCGACVVSVRVPLRSGTVMAVNSCLISVLSCHEWDITAVEGIGNAKIGYHDIQTRLASFNGTQCGYCTPGWINSMYSLYESKNKDLTMKEIENSFASNICRCTGYRAIVEAFKSFAKDAPKELTEKVIDIEELSNIKNCAKYCTKLCNREDKCEDENINVNDNEWCIIEKDTKMMVIAGGSNKWYRATSLADIFKAMEEGDYKIVAGNTGQGVYHIQGYPSNIIDIFSVSELSKYLVDVNLILGACMTLNQMMEVFLQLSDNPDFSYLKEFHEHMDLVAHIPVKNIGTIGGNLGLKHANKDFASDLFLLFETVGGMLTLAEANRTTIVSLPDFLKTDMNKKIILNVMLPPLSQSCTVKTYKIMPVSQNSQATVHAGFCFKFHHNSPLLESARIVYGGLSPDFIHASRTEELLVGKDPFVNDTLQMALKSLMEEIDPVEDPVGGSAAYRKQLAVALYYKAIISLCPDDKIDAKYKSGGEVFKRSTSHATQTFDTDKTVWPLNQPIMKLEALAQCSGEAIFTNDLPGQNREVFCAFVTADVPAGSVIKGFDVDVALKEPGVIAFYSAKDIPGSNTFTPTEVPLMNADEEILCEKDVKFFGQPCGIIVANTARLANKATESVKVKYSYINNDKILATIDDVLVSDKVSERVVTDQTIEPTEVGSDVKHVIEGEYKIEGQYHYTMETQTCVAMPTEDGMEVYSSTQWLDLTNVAVAKCLGVPVNRINIIVRRLGGAYGCKISRATQIACSASLVAFHLNRPCRMVLPMEVNMKIIGKRLPVLSKFEIGVNSAGVIQYLKNVFYQDKGHSFNETVSTLTAIHFSSCYNSRSWYIQANSAVTDMPSNTWCRAPGSAEGIAMIEYMMEKIALSIDKDPLELRLANLTKDPNPFLEMIEQLKRDSDYDQRVKDIMKFNQDNRWKKRAIRMQPATIDIFYLGNFNSIVSIYHGDASVVIIHGGIEMGQGLNTKAAQVCAYTLGIPLDKVSVKPSTSFTSPNCIVTGASIGSECVSFATMKACETLVERLAPIKAKLGDPSWEELINEAFTSGIDLQASHMFSVNNDGVKPYNVYAVSVIEVEVDILTGNHNVRRVDLLEDVGRSLSPNIDVAQIEGAFVMGLGYWTSEKLVHDHKTGRLLTDRTWTYKPPGIKDIPEDMRIYFRRNARNEYGVLQSKATGEPSLCLAVSVTHALRAAVCEARKDAGFTDKWVDIKNPCTTENIFMAVEHKIEDYRLK